MHVSIRQFFGEHFDDAISDFKIGELLDFFVSELGPPVYNQAIQDARRYLQEKLTDLEGEFYEPDEPYVR